MRVFSFITTCVLCLACGWSVVMAQSSDEGRRGGRGGGESDRGGERWDRGRGGFPGGGGGFPSGGGFGGGGGGGGGFGGGGFPGGGRGGDRGGGGGPGGGFNPADMIRRFDRNGNNMIDPDEAQGPAQFFLQRMAQNNPKIDLSKPVPIDLLTGEIDRMRGGGGGGGDAGEEIATDGPSLMVPDFKLSSTPSPVPGFGASSSKFTVKVEERDLKEAEERLRRYDENRDGFLSPEELRRGRWPDDPMQYDRNRDGKLSAAELAVRYANQRIQEASRNVNNNDRNARGQGNNNGWVRSDGREEAAREEESRFGDAKSYRVLSRKETVSSIKGLPDFFARSDADGDGQVLMSEFSSSWNEETLAEFRKWDLNNDGIITAKECLEAVAKGARGSSSSSSSSAPVASASSGQPAAAGGATPDASQMEWAARQIAKYDLNGDNQLTANEWEKMIIKPDGADLNGDGAITVEEYAAFRAKKK